MIDDVDDLIDDITRERNAEPLELTFAEVFDARQATVLLADVLDPARESNGRQKKVAAKTGPSSEAAAGDARPNDSEGRTAEPGQKRRKVDDPGWQCHVRVSDPDQPAGISTCGYYNLYTESVCARCGTCRFDRPAEIRARVAALLQTCDRSKTSLRQLQARLEVEGGSALGGVCITARELQTELDSQLQQRGVNTMQHSAAETAAVHLPPHTGTEGLLDGLRQTHSDRLASTAGTAGEEADGIGDAVTRAQRIRAVEAAAGAMLDELRGGSGVAVASGVPRVPDSCDEPEATTKPLATSTVVALVNPSTNLPKAGSARPDTKRSEKQLIEVARRTWAGAGMREPGYTDERQAEVQAGAPEKPSSSRWKADEQVGSSQRDDTPSINGAFQPWRRNSGGQMMQHPPQVKVKPVRPFARLREGKVPLKEKEQARWRTDQQGLPNGAQAVFSAAAKIGIQDRVLDAAALRFQAVRGGLEPMEEDSGRE